MKYNTIGAFKNVQNVPYCKAASDMKVGMGVVLDRVAKTATLPATEADCKATTYVVTNINDKPEVGNTEQAFAVKKGEFVRADDLRTVAGKEAEFAAFEISGGTEGLTTNDLLVFGTDGLIKKVSDATGYAIVFKMIDKTAYMDGGILVEIIAQ